MQFESYAKTVIDFNKTFLDFVDFCRFLSKVAVLIRTTPSYAYFGHTQNLNGVQKLQDKNISGVHMPHSADRFLGNVLQSCKSSSLHGLEVLMSVVIYLCKRSCGDFLV